MQSAHANPDTYEADPHQVDEAHYRQVLRTLIDQAAALATRIAATATAASTPDAALPEAAIALDRITRCIRRTIALARHIAANPAPRPSPARTPRAQLIRGVEDVIHARRGHCDAEAVTAEFRERLEDPMLDLDLEGRTVDDVIVEICRDLGIPRPSRLHEWKRRTPEDIRRLRTRASPVRHGHDPRAAAASGTSPAAAASGTSPAAAASGASPAAPPRPAPS